MKLQYKKILVSKMIEIFHTFIVPNIFIVHRKCICNNKLRIYERLGHTNESPFDVETKEDI